VTPQQEQQLSRDVGDLRVTAARIEGQLTGVTASLAESKATDQSLEVRVRGLEAWRWKIMGMATAISALASWVYQVVSHR
jgi:hypothetical protein